MNKPAIQNIFLDEAIIQKIKNKLPTLFQMAELDNSRDGKLGMEIGSTRERIIIALLISYYGAQQVNTRIPITEKEADVILCNEPISIKTLTNRKLVGVKLIWTVDATKSQEFIDRYVPDMDILLVQINWKQVGGIYLFSKAAQQDVLETCGKNGYFKLPKAGTNPRGVEMSNEAINLLAAHETTLKIDIDWKRDEQIDYDAYERWVRLWNEE